MPQPDLFHGRLTGWRAIVTGAGTLGDGVGTGKAIAALFAAEGARIALIDLDRDRAEASLALLGEFGGEGAVFCGNVADPAEAGRVCNEALAWLGELDILVNNVGIASGGGRLHEVAQAELDGVFQVNLGSVLNMVRQCAPALIAGHGKAIINVASVAGMLASGNAAYGPSKAAMIQLTRELAVMYGRDGVRANCVAPGHIVTPMVAAHVQGDARRLRSAIAPLGVEGDAWDIAQAALFLASPESRFVTGQTLAVDGGATSILPLTAAGLADKL